MIFRIEMKGVGKLGLFGGGGLPCNTQDVKTGEIGPVLSSDSVSALFALYLFSICYHI